MSANAETPGAVRALYVHVPFCERRCHYCDFVALAGTVREVPYLAALRTEITQVGTALGRPTLDTVFFGGGTPSLVDPQALAEVLHAVKESFEIADGAEITLEANPSSVSAERAAIWRQAGFNRISLGVQSFDNQVLRFLGRVHDSEQARRALAEVRAAGFDNVNCDLIYAVPGLDDDAWAGVLEAMVELRPDHISAYELTVEQGTPLDRMVSSGRVAVVDVEVALRQHAITVARLAAAGYAQYEVSNFAQPGRSCRHNLAYWNNRSYVGVGVGAHGQLRPEDAHLLSVDPARGTVALRYWHGRRLDQYIDAVASGGLGVESVEMVDSLARREELVMLGLRLDTGIAADLVDPDEAEALLAAGLLSRHEQRLLATPRGQEVLNQVTGRLAQALAVAGGTQ